MSVKIFSIFDKKSLAYQQLFYCTHKGEALRVLESLVNDTQTMIHKYPKDFSLWQIGEWDQRTGQITALPKTEFLEEACVFEKVGV